MEDPPDTTTEGPCFFSLFSFTIAVIMEKATGFFFLSFKKKRGTTQHHHLFPCWRRACNSKGHQWETTDRINSDTIRVPTHPHTTRRVRYVWNCLFLSFSNDWNAWDERCKQFDKKWKLERRESWQEKMVIATTCQCINPPHLLLSSAVIEG